MTVIWKLDALLLHVVVHGCDVIRNHIISTACNWPLITRGLISHGEGLCCLITTLAQCRLMISNPYLEHIGPGFLPMFSFCKTFSLKLNDL
uniref:SFRICE_031337 n=1 Tax=Spodoptera frugiperda TaxID=7108 RepID=A0A2H1WW10_SPOFR